MSFRLGDEENFTDDVRRIAIEQLDKALERSARKENNYRTAVHDVRVCYKKIRATLRLARGGIDPDLFRIENTFYRDAGRRLAPLRNPAALAEACDQLIEHFARDVARGKFAELRERLRVDEARGGAGAAKAMREAAGQLRAARRRIQRWPVACDGFCTLKAGLGRTYRSGRRAFAEAYENPTVEAFHEWRKDVKNLYYEVRILRPIWPGVMKALAGELKSLGDSLSEEHDLALLRRKIVRESRNSGAVREDAEALMALIDERRAQLRANARELGGRIYAARPREFLKRLRAYWTGWRAEIEAGHVR